MKSNISKILIGIIISVGIVLCAFSYASANPQMYVFSGYVTNKSPGGDWPTWDASGYPAISVGDWFVGSFFYSFDEEPNLVWPDGGYYDITNFYISTIIHFKNFYVQSNMGGLADMSSNRTQLQFYWPTDMASTKTIEGKILENVHTDDLRLFFNFSNSLVGNGFPKILDTSTFIDGVISLVWFNHESFYNGIGINCKIVSIKSVAAEEQAGPIDCTLDPKFKTTTMQKNVYYYTDRDYRITGGFFDWMNGRTMIQTPNDERFDKSDSGYMRFTNPVDWWVYVLFDSRSASIPDWLKGWELRGEKITTSLSSQPYLKVYRKQFPAGQCVNLGGNYGPGSSGETRSNYAVVYGK